MKSKRKGLALLAVGAAVILGACQNELTPDGNPYKVTVNGSSFSVANTNGSGINEREVFVPSKVANEADSTYSATWNSGTPGQDDQNGVIFRGVTNANKLWSGVVLERSFYLNPAGFFIVIYFHDGSFTTGPSVQLPNDGSWPLNLSASISGSTLTFSINGGADQTLALDPSQVPASGQTGTYFAHVPTGTTDVVSNVQIDGAPAPSPTS